MRPILPALAGLVLFLPVGVISAADEHGHDHAGHDHAGHDHGAHKHEAKPYGLATCIIDTKALGEKPVVFVHKEHEIKLCSEACKEAFMKDADANLKLVKEAQRAAKKEAKEAKKAEKDAGAKPKEEGAKAPEAAPAESK